MLWTTLPTPTAIAWCQKINKGRPCWHTIFANNVLLTNTYLRHICFDLKTDELMKERRNSWTKKWMNKWTPYPTSGPFEAQAGWNQMTPKNRSGSFWYRKRQLRLWDAPSSSFLSCPHSIPSTLACPKFIQLDLLKCPLLRPISTGFQKRSHTWFIKGVAHWCRPFHIHSLEVTSSWS